MTLSVTSGAPAPGGAAIPGRARVLFGSGGWRRVAMAWREVARGRVLPAAVRAELGLDRGERVLAVAGDRDRDHVLVATDRALYHRVPPPAGPGFTRIGWEQVAQVGWDGAAGQLIVIGAADPAGAAPGAVAGAVASCVAVPLRRRGGIPELALERVTHTRLGQWQLLAGGRARVVIEARRRPGTGELLWSVSRGGDGGDGGDGYRPGDQDTRARAERAIARLSAELGASPQPGQMVVALGRPQAARGSRG